MRLTGLPQICWGLPCFHWGFCHLLKCSSVPCSNVQQWFWKGKILLSLSGVKILNIRRQLISYSELAFLRRFLLKWGKNTFYRQHETEGVEGGRLLVKRQSQEENQSLLWLCSHWSILLPGFQEDWSIHKELQIINIAHQTATAKISPPREAILTLLWMRFIICVLRKISPSLHSWNSTRYVAITGLLSFWLESRPCLFGNRRSG